MMLNRILIKIANIENILSKFLISSAEGFLLVETRILNDQNFVSKLVNHFFLHINTIHALDITNNNSIISL